MRNIYRCVSFRGTPDLSSSGDGRAARRRHRRGVPGTATTLAATRFGRRVRGTAE